MVDVNAANYAATYGSQPVGKVASNQNYGRRRVLYDTLEATGEGIGDDILIGKLASGAVIHDFNIMTEALGASSTLQIITRSDDTDQTEVVISDPIATDTAGSFRPVAADIAFLPAFVSANDFNGEVTVLLRVAGGTVTGTIKAWLETVVD